MSGQADEAPEIGGLSDLAAFVSEIPDTDPEDDEVSDTVDESTSEEADTEESASDDQDEESEGEEPEEDKPAPIEKITFKVKGENGEEQTVEATTEELAKSYMRQQDYTRKTQALAERENQAVQLLASKHEEIRNQYLQQAEVARAAVAQVLGIRSEDEMAQLANSDPAAWVAEQQRQRQINAFLNGLDQQIGSEKQKASQEQEQQRAQTLKQAYEYAWAELSKDGIDKPKLADLYSKASKNYGFTNAELSEVYDPRMVRVLKDAAAYRELKAKQPEVTKKATNAPRMPSRQSAPEQERVDRALDNKFKQGRAKLNDLAAFLR